jgi:hypothetical protein
MVAFGALPAGADDEPAQLPPFTASAAADGMRFSLNSPGAPITANVIDGGGPTAQAQLSSTSGSGAFAALPYPGDIFLAGPSTAAGLLAASGVALPAAAPGYPFIAAASTPGTADQTVGDGPYKLEAHSGEDKALSNARVGLDADGTVQALYSKSDASATKTAEGVVSKATNEVHGVTAGPLKLMSVTSVAEVALDTGGNLKRTSSLEVVVAQADGTPLALKSEGSPASLGEAVAQFNEQVKPTGVEFSATPQADTSDGVLAPVLWVRMLTPSSPVFGAATWTIASGRTSAAITTEASSSPPAPVEEGVAPASGEGTDASSPPPEVPAVSATDQAGTTTPLAESPNWTSSAASALESDRRDAAAFPPADSLSLAAPTPAAGATTAAAAPGAAADGQQVSLAGTGRRGTEPFDLGALYIVVAIAGLAGALLGGVFKVRAAWKF